LAAVEIPILRVVGAVPLLGVIVMSPRTELAV
jgi:hypothetical protein